MDIVLTDRTPAIERLKIPAGRYATPRASPDGKRIAFVSDDGSEATIWTYNLAGTSAMQRLTLGGRNRFPIWTSDSQRVAFQSDRDGDLAIFWQSADGVGTPERLTKPAPGEAHVPESWFPTGVTLLFSVTKGSDISLAMLSLRDRVVTPFGDVHSSTLPSAVFSPDGRWVAYATTEQGRTTDLRPAIPCHRRKVSAGSQWVGFASPRALVSQRKRADLQPQAHGQRSGGDYDATSICFW